MAKARRPRFRNLTPSERRAQIAFTEREQLFVLISQIAHFRERKLEAELAPLGVSLTLWRAMVVIQRIDDCSMSDLGRFALADRTTLTRAVDHLVAKGLVERYVSPDDRRLVLLRLTPAGAELFDRALRTTLDVNAEIVAGAALDPGPLTALLEQLLGGLFPDREDQEVLADFARDQLPTTS